MALIKCPECSRDISDRAEACLHCGYPINQSSLTTPTRIIEGSSKECPSCKSRNTQTIKMMCLSGSSSGASTAVAVDSHLDVGVAKIGSRSQTKLASLYYPGAKPKDGIGCGSILYVFAGLFILIILASLSKISFDGSLFLVIFSIAVLIGLGKYFNGLSKVTPARIQAWEEKNKLHESGWICHTCGTTWCPEIE